MSDNGNSDFEKKFKSWFERRMVGIQTVSKAEEQERQRLAFESKEMAAAADKEIAAKLALSLPFKPGLRADLGGIVVCWIPAGRFMMGSPSTELGRDPDEGQHEVELSRGLFMSETECTQGQWEAVMSFNPSTFKGSNRPVERVNWGEAVEYCRTLTAKQRQEGILPAGWEWRLPTEAEWEYAARAGTREIRYGELNAIAWHDGNSGGKTQEVKGKLPNSWGLYDMLGNVWEWCEDWYEKYTTASVVDPKGPEKGSCRVYRGGSWNYGFDDVRCAGRIGNDPGRRYSFLGFRPSLSLVRLALSQECNGGD